MAQLVVRNLDEDVKTRLQRRASRAGRSMEEEVRDILRQAVLEQGQIDDRLGSRISARFAGLGLDQEIPEIKGETVEPATFER